MNAQPASNPETTRWERLQRWIVLTVSIVGLGLGVYALIHAVDQEARSLSQRLGEIIALATESAMFCIAWLIAFRAGHSRANLAIALAIAAIYFNGTLGTTLTRFGHEHDALAHTINGLTYFLGAVLFVRASQLFPVAITGERIAQSKTIWGRWKALRLVLTVLLKPTVLWPVIGGLVLLDALAGVQWFADVSRLCIIGLGIVYFYVNYRAGDDEVRRKVLWFLALAIGSAVVSLLVLAALAALATDTPSVLRTVLSITLNVLNGAVQIFCVSAAVFYAGALSPSLIIRKTVVFGLTTALLLFVFASVEVFLHHQIVHFLEVTDTFASSLIGGVFGLTFHPVKHYFEHLLQRVFGKHSKAQA